MMLSSYRGQIPNFVKNNSAFGESSSYDWKEIGYVTPSPATINMAKNIFERKISNRYEYCSFDELIVSKVKKMFHLPENVQKVHDGVKLKLDGDNREWVVNLFQRREDSAANLCA